MALLYRAGSSCPLWIGRMARPKITCRQPRPAFDAQPKLRRPTCLYTLKVLLPRGSASTDQGAGRAETPIPQPDIRVLLPSSTFYVPLILYTGVAPQFAITWQCGTNTGRLLAKNASATFEKPSLFSPNGTCEVLLLSKEGTGWVLWDLWFAFSGLVATVRYW